MTEANIEKIPEVVILPPKETNSDNAESPSHLLELAINKKLGIETIEKLLALQERWEKAQAEKKFNLAMANFQKRCPVIKKKSSVKTKTGDLRYKFAPIGDIISQTKDLISANDLFYDFTAEDANDFMIVTCTVTHSAGHSKSSSFKIPIGKEEYMTDVQKYGARRTFAQRYAFCNAFGIVTAEDDNDAAATGSPKSEKEIADQKAYLEDKINTILICETEEQVMEFAKSMPDDVKKNAAFRKACMGQIKKINPKSVADKQTNLP